MNKIYRKAFLNPKNWKLDCTRTAKECNVTARTIEKVWKENKDRFTITEVVDVEE